MSFCLTLNRDNPSYFPTYNMFRIWNKIIRKNRNVEIAKKAIPNCNITYIDKTEMKQALSGYLDVLFHQDSLSIGGGLPESDFYYDAE